MARYRLLTDAPWQKIGTKIGKQGQENRTVTYFRRTERRRAEVTLGESTTCATYAGRRQMDFG